MKEGSPISHISEVELIIKDLPSLVQAVGHMGGTFHEGQTTHTWYGRFVGTRGDVFANRDPETFGKCTHAISFPGIRYEVGVCADTKGAFSLVYDAWGKYAEHDGEKLEAKCGGPGLPTLKNEYAAAVATRQLARRGFRVARTETKGVITLRARN